MTLTEPAEKNVKFSTTVGYFDKSIEALDSLRDEGIVIFREDGIFSKVVDPSTVAMCISKIEGQALNSLRLEKTEEIRAGLNFEDIRDCLTGTSSNSEIEVTWPVTDGTRNMIKLDIIDEDIQFELPTRDLDTVPNVPKQDPLSHSTRIVVSGKDLKQAVDHAGKITDDDSGSVIFETYEGVFQLRASDKVDGRFSKQFYQSGPSDEEELGEHQTEISMSYLEDINDVFGRGSEMTVHVKDTQPIRFDVDLDDKGDAQVVYIIAPRVDRNE